MDGMTDILVLGIGTAGARACYYLNQRQALGNAQIIGIDSDEEHLASLTPLETLPVPKPPALPAGAQATAACDALENGIANALGKTRMAAIVTCLGGDTAAFYTQAALLCCQKAGIPAVTFAAMPHAFDSQEQKNGATQTLDVLRAQHFDVVTLECTRLGTLLPECSSVDAYRLAVLWLVDTAIGYLTIFAQRKRFSTVTSETSSQNSSLAMKFNDMPRGIFSGTPPTVHNQEDLDIPTCLRRNLDLQQ